MIAERADQMKGIFHVAKDPQVFIAGFTMDYLCVKNPFLSGTGHTEKVTYVSFKVAIRTVRIHRGIPNDDNKAFLEFAVITL